METVVSPPAWLSDAPYWAWEIVGDFLAAHELDGAAAVRSRASDLGSPRRELFELKEALTACEDGDIELAASLIAANSSTAPVVEIARSRIGNDPDAVLATVRLSRIEQSEDSEMALFGLGMIAWAHAEKDEVQLAIDTTKRAIERFPDRGSLFLREALLTLSLAGRAAMGSAASDRLFRRAAELAIEARDRHRRWKGPSALAVKVASDALGALADPERVLALTTQAPDGEATHEEAKHLEVRSARAKALVFLQRNAELAAMDLGGVSEFDACLVRATQARNRGDENAVQLMRNAVASASDEGTRIAALYGLALFGEIDEDAVLALSVDAAADSALVRAVAAYHLENYKEAVQLLIPYRAESVVHTHWLAEAQAKTGSVEDAIGTLIRAAEVLGAPSLREEAAYLLLDDQKFDRAEMVAGRALLEDPPPAVEQRLRMLLVAIAERRKDWQTMFTYADALTSRFDDDIQGPWAAVLALCRQEKRRDAWQYMTSHGLSPFDEHTALIEIGLRGVFDTTPEGVERVLVLASQYSDSESVVAAAIGILMSGGDRLPFDDEHRMRLGRLTDEFVEQYPHSPLLMAIDASDIEDLRREMKTRLAPGAEDTHELANRVRNGHLPYGALQFIRSLPYAELLIERAAGSLTAIFPEKSRCETERVTVADAIGGRVVVDTSVVVLCELTGIALNDVGSRFGDLVVPDELVIDARRATTSLAEPVEAYLGYSPAIDELVMSPVDSDERNRLLGVAKRVAQVLEGLDVMPSGGLVWPERCGESDFAPWDAAVRLAADLDCVLWADDIMLRRLAESVGVPTFGSYAVVEVLNADDPPASIPEIDEFKRELVRQRIADVPLTYSELSTIAIEFDYSPFPAGLVLARPGSWSDPTATLAWHRESLRHSLAGPDRNQALSWVHCASLGSGFSVESDMRTSMVGVVLADALLVAADPHLTSPLVAACRAAWHQVDPSGALDALPRAIEILLEILVPILGIKDATHYVAYLFSAAESNDRSAATSVLLGVRS